MSQVNSGYKAFTVGTGGVSRYERVKLSSGTVVACTGDDYGIGFAEESVAVGGVVTVKLNNVSGTFKAIAGDAFSAGDAIYGVAGKVESAGTTLRYVALETATADGDIVEVLPTTLA